MVLLSLCFLRVSGEYRVGIGGNNNGIGTDKQSLLDTNMERTVDA